MFDPPHLLKIPGQICAITSSNLKMMGQKRISDGLTSVSFMSMIHSCKFVWLPSYQKATFILIASAR